MAEKIYLWGTGNIASQVLDQYERYIYYNYDVKGFIDSDCMKHGRVFHGKMIYPPTVLLNGDYDYLIMLIDYSVDAERAAQVIYNCSPEKIRNRFYFHEQSLLDRYKNSSDKEILQVLKYIKKNGLSIFNYDYVKKYADYHVEVVYDEEWGGYYVFHNGKKMYIKKSYNTESLVRQYYRSLLSEQDEDSPHLYLDDNNRIKKGDIIIDAGAAEGFFALDHIDEAAKIFIIEADEEWADALRETFRPYKDKIVLVEKYLSDISNGVSITIDEITNEKVGFLKMDIEGNEWDALKGAKETFERSDDIRCAICCYHTDYDQELIEQKLDDYNMKRISGRGYMWFPYITKNHHISDRLHKGIIRAWKES